MKNHSAIICWFVLILINSILKIIMKNAFWMKLKDDRTLSLHAQELERSIQVSISRIIID